MAFLEERVGRVVGVGVDYAGEGVVALVAGGAALLGDLLGFGPSDERGGVEVVGPHVDQAVPEKLRQADVRGPNERGTCARPAQGVGFGRGPVQLEVGVEVSSVECPGQLSWG